MDDLYADGLPAWPTDKKKQKTSNGGLQLPCKFPKIEATASPETEQAAVPARLQELQEVNSTIPYFDYAFAHVSASFDLATLDCPFCKRSLLPPIYQCYSGHYACTVCNDSNMRKCPTCNRPIGKIRNLGLESIIRTLRIKCKFTSSGCAEILKHEERKDHEMVCPYAPHMCPILDCDFCGPLKDFGSHFSLQHKAQSVEFSASHCVNVPLGKHDLYTILRVADKPLFLLHNRPEELGNVLHLTSFCTPPRNSSIKWGFQLNIFKGKSKITLDSVAYSHEDLMVETRPTDFLMIPSHFFDTHRKVDATSQDFEFCEMVEVDIQMQTDFNGFKLIKV